MIRFESDYTEGAHPKILERLIQTNDEQTPGYGEDVHCERAAGYIRNYCGREDAAVHFLVGGTQANLTVISALLRPHQGVIASEWGHIERHETGAIESTGHKVLPQSNSDGKITASQIDAACKAHIDDPDHEQIVQPGMVYISHPTENGTIYTKPELEGISASCRKWGIPLFMDGARLGYGLAASVRWSASGDALTLPDIAALCDVFYIGGTKVGAMFGEAVVITTERYKEDFRYLMKQRGAMLAKGRMLGIQFEALFEDGLYFEISDHAVVMADIIRQACAKKGYKFMYETVANQIFLIFPEHTINELRKSYAFATWGDAGEINGEKHFVVRLCTSWATKEENARKLAEDIVAII